VTVTDVSGVSFELFVTGVVFILLIGSFLSLGVLRLFQQRKRQGIIYLVLSVVSFFVMLWVVLTFFQEGHVS
jgi:hypothetical protein